MLAQTLTTSSTYEFLLTATKNGVAFDLTGATVNLLFKDPSGNVTTKSATVNSPPTAGVANYVSLTTDITVAGLWTRAWQIIQAPATNVTSSAITFRVAAAP